jgi:hypothetical protein
MLLVRYLNISCILLWINYGITDATQLPVLLRIRGRQGSTTGTIVIERYSTMLKEVVGEIIWSRKCK